MAATPRFVTVARLSELPPGAVRQVLAEDRAYALANVRGQVYALPDACPHNGGPLGKGILRGPVLECPWHHWRWDVTTGRVVSPPGDWRTPRVSVQVVGDEIQLLLP